MLFLRQLLGFSVVPLEGDLLQLHIAVVVCVPILLFSVAVDVPSTPASSATVSRGVAEASTDRAALPSDTIHF